MEITVIRHAETIDNQRGICQGQVDGQLSSHGIEQASEACKVLSNEKFDIIFTSDLQRTVETCSIIFPHDGTKTVKDRRLRERFFGLLQGQKIVADVDYDGVIDGAESMDELFDRVRYFLVDIKREHNNKRVAVVSHGIAIKVMTSICQQRDVTQIATPANCAVLRLNI